MSRWSKRTMFGVGTATLVAATVVVPRFAGAAEAAPAVQLEICNNSGSSDINVNITGTNQDGQEVTAPTVWIRINDVNPIPCTTLENWWWRMDTDLSIGYVNKDGRGDTATCRISSSLQNGSTYTIYPVLGSSGCRSLTP